MTRHNNSEELFIALREHQAYRECIEFEGDECATCEEIENMIDATEARDLYNERYADYVSRRAALYASDSASRAVLDGKVISGNPVRINETDCINAHAWAAGDEDSVPPPHGYITVPADADTDVCGRCNGTGLVSFFWVDKGRCWRCLGTGKAPDAADRFAAAAEAADEAMEPGNEHVHANGCCYD